MRNRQELLIPACSVVLDISAFFAIGEYLSKTTLLLIKPFTESKNRLSSTVNWVLPMCLLIPVCLFLTGRGLLMLVLAKPLPDRTGFLLMFVRRIEYLSCCIFSIYHIQDLIDIFLTKGHSIVIDHKTRNAHNIVLIF